MAGFRLLRRARADLLEIGAFTANRWGDDPAERYLIEQPTVDAYDESERATGWFTIFEEQLDLPFETEVLGVRVTVESIDLRGDDRIVAMCKRGKIKQPIAITDLPLPTPKPRGAEWIEAYRHWRDGR